MDSSFTAVVSLVTLVEIELVGLEVDAAGVLLVEEETKVVEVVLVDDVVAAEEGVSDKEEAEDNDDVEEIVVEVVDGLDREGSTLALDVSGDSIEVTETELSGMGKTRLKLGVDGGLTELLSVDKLE